MYTLVFILLVIDLFNVERSGSLFVLYGRHTMFSGYYVYPVVDFGVTNFAIIICVFHFYLAVPVLNEIWI